MYVYSVTCCPLANDLCTLAARDLTSGDVSGSDIPGGTEAPEAVSASAPPNGSGPGPAPEREAVPISMTGNPAPAPDAASAPLHIPASSSDASLPSSID